MVPLVQALQQASFQSKTDDGTFCYHCNLHPSWAISAVPQGGYTLGVIVDACIQYQSAARSSHPDPIYISAHFLRAASVGIAQIRLKPLKSGKTFTNITAELVQQGKTKITAHLIFGDLSPPQPGQERRVLEPPSPYARRLPLYSHPSSVSPDSIKPFWAEAMGIRLSTDVVLLSQNDPNGPARTTTESVGGGGVLWGAWFELTDKDDMLITTSIPFFCDCFVNLPNLLPRSEPGSTEFKPGEERFPTVVMAIEFKARIPTFVNHSARTVGVYCESRFQSDPEGRHNARIEVWTAPSEIGRGTVTEGWRDDQYCIAVADQVALILPLEEVTNNPAKL